MNIPAFSIRPGFTPGRFVAVLAASAAVVSGCNEKSPPPSAGPAVIYEIRGVIVALPRPGDEKSNLMIHHEAIPTFARKGEVVGMSEMTMPFPTAKGVSLDGLDPGDLVIFTMEVREQPILAYEVTKIAELPAGTVLNLKAPPGGTPKPETTPPPASRPDAEPGPR